MIRGYAVGIFSQILLSFIATGQDVGSMPKLYPSSVTAYDLEQGMPISCAWDGLEDQKGRLWITPCFGQPEHQTVNFYQYDGRRAEEIYWGNLPEGASGQASLAGITDEGELFGFFRKTNHFFFFHPDTRRTRFYQLDRGQADIIYMGYAAKHGLIVLAAYANRQLIYQLRRDTLRLLLDYSSSIDHDKEVEKDRFFPNYQLLAGNELWFCEARDMVFSGVLRDRFKILRFNLSSHSLTQYALHDLFAGASPPPPDLFRYRVNLVQGPQGQILLADKGHIYQIDTLAGKAVLRWVFPHAMDHLGYIFDYRIERDAVGNLLFLFPDAANHYVGVLMDTTGQLYDYSAVLKSTVGASRFQSTLHYNVWSRDFRRNLLAFQQGGVIAADLQYYGTISTFFLGFATRGIAEWKPGEYLVRPEVGDRLYWARPFSHHKPEQVDGSAVGAFPHPVAMSNLVNAAGYKWFSHGDDLIRLDGNKKYSSFHIGTHFTKFAFVDKHTVALALEGKGLYFFDLVQQKLSPWLQNGQPLIAQDEINELLVAKDNTLWIATLQGLWHIDLKTRKSTRFGRQQGFRDERMVCLHEDKQGRIWIGTYAGGLHIFNPPLGEVKVLDRQNGLSNNTVVGILSDEEDIHWVSTYKGLNLISADGEILTHLYEEDGLSTNEFNRFSYCKDSKGRLLFGSVNGVNVIHPELLKGQLRLAGEPQIFLTSLTRFDARQGADVTQYYGFDRLGTLSLPADHRYLILNFSLSSLVRMNDHHFAYKVVYSGQPHASEWIYLGNKSQINLSNLPPGRCKIFIRGRNHRGYQVPESLILEVQVAEFFYKTWWFYVLCALPFLLGAYFWIKRLLTERERLEAEVASRTKQIRHDKELIERQAAELQELDEMKSSFFTNISHEFRTPLTVINGMADIILENPGKWPDKEAGIIRRNGKVLLDLVKQILDLKKLESGMLQMQLIQGDILAYLRYITESFTSLAGGKNVRLDFQTDRDDLIMDYDPEKIRQIVSNLLSNAIKFTPEGGSVTLTAVQKTEGQQAFLVLRVKDTGPGIAPKDLPHVFNLFYQARHSDSHKAQGTGVGLALVQELTRLMQGEVAVSSRLQEGSVFTVQLPVTRNAPPEAEGTRSESQTAQEPDADTSLLVPEPTTRKDLPSLLVVEDNRDIIRYLVSCLENQFNITIAYDGQEGIEKALEQTPDIILSDVMMPRKDGLELCETLKQDERTSHVPIVLLTAKVDVESRIAGLRRGADAYLAKPFNREELLVSLQQLIELRRRLQDRYRNLEIPEPSEDPVLQQEDAFMQKLLAPIEQRFEDTRFGAPELGHALGMSRSGLYAKVKALTDRTPALLIRSIRLQKAKELLGQKEMNISEVAYAVGFDDPAYFSRCFSEEFGHSPSQYRETR